MSEPTGTNQPQSGRANVKPLVHWAMRRKCTLRFHSRRPERVTGALTLPDGRAVDFAYVPQSRALEVGDDEAGRESIRLDTFGWELDDAGHIDMQRMMRPLLADGA